MGYGVGDYPLWYYLIQPVIAGVVGYITNVLALEMTFRPIEFFGPELFRIKDQPWGLFGWQGIIPTKAEKMASVCFDLMTTKLLNLKEIFDRLDPKKFGEVMEDALLLMLDTVVNEVAMEYMPSMWSSLPKEVKDEVIVVMNIESETFLVGFMEEIKAHIDDILDIKQMTVAACVENKVLVNKIFQECGEKEFIFIRRSGFYFGFLFGLLQMGVFFIYDASWVLPFFGFLVGWATNWVALKVIFRPLNPQKIGPFTIHGIFLKRQKEVSETFARVNCVEILHTKAIWETILNGPLSSNFYAMLRAHSIVFTEKLVGGMKPLAVTAMGSQQFSEMKEEIAKKIAENLPIIMPHSYQYTTEALDMENTIRERMQKLSYPEFEGVLHPAFEEDEILLIFVGGVLGLIAGAIQVVIFY
ncbi:predicted protein [Thalassiosira pseudonana CCMP1335]|uniref:DUF445 domain-containing protein n=1 Tax=Thalassiosira pseudonana TaxID=35128 RepID=B8C8A7_THAPS|nr:predicted protein [Thalassiosira pseudonana CCMP1335]EED90255.1 predicted protein [Thalassiosira pseudonana CCMP1335]|eukprot:scaffold5476_cov195-Alexandrium_tamarense.AAC.5